MGCTGLGGLLVLVLVELVSQPVTSSSVSWACSPYDLRSPYVNSRIISLPRAEQGRDGGVETYRFAIQGKLPVVLTFDNKIAGNGVTYEVAFSSLGRLSLERDGVKRNQSTVSLSAVRVDVLSHVWVRFSAPNNTIEFGFEGDTAPRVSWRDPEFTFPSYCRMTGHAIWITKCDEPEPDPPLTCRLLTSTQRYDFKDSQFPVDKETINTTDGSLVIRFLVRASRDAFIRLSADREPTPSRYEIDLNFSGMVSLQRGNTYVKTTPHSDAVDPTELRLFTVNITNRVIQLFDGRNAEPIFSFRDFEPFTIRYISFASMGVVPVLWVHGCQGIPQPPPQTSSNATTDADADLFPIPLPTSGGMPELLANGTSLDKVPPGCMVLHTFKYRFDAFFAISEVGNVNGSVATLPLSVVGRKDVHLHLVSSIPPSLDLYYEIDLDFFNRTNLDRGKENKVVSVEQSSLLSPTELRTFILSHNSETGLLSLTKDNGVPVLTWRDPNPFPLRYFSLSSGSSAGNDTAWVFGCPARQPTAHQRDLLASGCSQSVHTHLYSHSQYFSVARNGEVRGDVITIRFYVRASSSAHIRLEPVLPPSTDAAYEVDLSHQNHSSIDYGGSQVSTAKTGSVVSLNRMSGFWIRQDLKARRIAVGQAGSETPLVQWTAPGGAAWQFKPFKYFSFATSRAAGNGTWMFGCKANVTPPAEEEAVPDGQVDVEEPAGQRLMKRLGGSYQPPILSGGKLTDLYLRLSVSKIYLVDELGGMQVRGHLKSRWSDQTLSWHPRDYDNITELGLEMGQIWTPDFVVYNGFGVLGGTVKVQQNGVVDWEAAVLLESPCELQARYWPADQHHCEVHVGLWASADRFNLVVAAPELETNDNVATPSWDLLSAGLRAGRQLTPWITGLWEHGPNTTLTLSVEVRRSTGIFYHLTLAPFVVLAALCLLAYWVRDPVAGDKAALGCGSLLLLVLSILVLQAACPAGMHGLPVTVELYCWCLLVVAVSVSLSTLMRALARESPWRCPPYLVRRCITSEPALWLISLCGGEGDLRPGPQNDTLNSVGYERGSSQAYVRSFGEDDCSCTESTCSRQATLEAHHYWHLLERLTERLISLICWAMLIAALFCA